MRDRSSAPAAEPNVAPRTAQADLNRRHGSWPGTWMCIGTYLQSGMEVG